MPKAQPILTLVILFASCWPARSFAFQLKAQSADIIEQNQVRLGFDFAQGLNRGDLATQSYYLDLPTLTLDLRLGDRAQAQLGVHGYRYVQQGLGANNPKGGADPWFFTKLQLPLADSLPRLAFIWGLHEPAANRPLGPDRMTFYALLAADMGKFPQWQVNYGAAIMESLERVQQQHVVVANGKVSFPLEKHALYLEGRWQDLTQGHWLDPSQAEASPLRRRQLWLGHSYPFSPRWQLDWALGRGFSPESGRWLIDAGLAWQF